MNRRVSLDMEILRLKDQGKAEGVLQGRMEARTEIIENMLRKGKTPREIADLCGLSVNEVNRVKTKNDKMRNLRDMANLGKNMGRF